MGLKNVGQIGRIVIDPHDPNHVVVAALGHAWGPNPDRGVFVTTDGGKTWRKSLFVNDHTGAIDVAMQAGNGQVLFAATWQAHAAARGRCMTAAPARDLALDRWRRDLEAPAQGSARRAPSAASAWPSRPAIRERVYALIETPIGKGSLFVDRRSRRPLAAGLGQPRLQRPRVLFHDARGRARRSPTASISWASSLLKSDDGGKTAHVIDESVHVDHHAMWIDPTNPKRMIQGNDGGAYLSLDGGKSWRFLDGMPIEQAYMVAADSRTPYDLCTGLQDNSGWCGPSSTLADDVVSGQDWFTVVGGDGEYAVPAPSNPDIIYADAQDGAITRFDRKTKQSLFIMPYLHGPGFINDLPTSAQKIRFNWTLADRGRSERREHRLPRRQRAAEVHRRRPQLEDDQPRPDPQRQVEAAAPGRPDPLRHLRRRDLRHPAVDPGRAERPERDLGRQRRRARIRHARWRRQLEQGDAAACARLGARLSDRRLAVTIQAPPMSPSMRTSWATTSRMPTRRPTTAITGARSAAGLPDDASVMVVRADPDDSQVLAAGTMRGVWISRDGGGHWTQLKSNLPTVPVFDLKFVRGDLVLATHGRGLWVAGSFRRRGAARSRGGAEAGEAVHAAAPASSTSGGAAAKAPSRRSSRRTRRTAS